MRLPGDDETTVAQTGNRRQLLVVGGIGVDLKLTADGDTIAVVALGMYAITPTILTVGVPDNDITAIVQLPNRRVALRTGVIGINRFVAEQRLGTIGLRGNVDGYNARLAGSAVAIADTDADGAGADRRRRRIAVGQVLDHRLYGRLRSIGVECNNQVGPVGTTADNTAHCQAADADRIAADADLAGRAAFITDTQLVLSANVLRQLGVADIAITRDNADPELAAIETD